MLLLLSAMPEEIEALRPALREVRELAGAGAARSAWQGRLHGHAITLAFSRWGKVAAAATATHLITRVQPSQVIFTGIAGALQAGVEVGDLVVARELYQHDLDASPFYAPTEIPLLGMAALPADEALSGSLLTAAHGWLAGARAAGEAVLPGQIVHGDIATGDQVIGTVAQREAVRRRVPQAVCVEMEGAAVAQVCHEFALPFACLRLISDQADERLAPADVYELARRSGRITAGILAHWRSSQQGHHGGTEHRDQHGADQVDEQA
jgi:adenosylhomocysteine nucleosidase